MENKILMNLVLDELIEIYGSIEHIVNCLENILETERNKKKFNIILEELKDIRIIKGDTKRTNIYQEIILLGNLGSNMTSQSYALLGFRNELSNSLLTIEDNKWYGNYNEERTMIRADKYQGVYSESTNQLFLSLPIYDTYTAENGDLYFIVQKPDCYNIRRKLKTYRSLPRQTENYILNIKTGACSCRLYKTIGICEHHFVAKNEREKLRNQLSYVLINKIGKTIAMQISNVCKLF